MEAAPANLLQRVEAELANALTNLTRAQELVSFLTDLKASLTTAPDPPKPADPPPVVTPPTPTALRLVPPSFVDSILTFKSEGGDGTKVEYWAAGVTDWTSNPVVRMKPLDKNYGPITIHARQSGKESTPLVYDLRKNEVVTTPPVVAPDPPKTDPPPVVTPPVVTTPPIDKPDTVTGKGLFTAPTYYAQNDR